MSGGAELATDHLVAAESRIRRFFRATEIDTRTLGMIGALLVIWLGFHFAIMIRQAPPDDLPEAVRVDSPMFGSLPSFLLALLRFVMHPGAAEWSAVTDTWELGVFITPRNLWDLLVQTSIIAVLATGMVLIIVTRQIDLSIGSMLSFIGVVAGVAQVYWLSPWLGSDHPAIWLVAVVVALALGALLGAFNGFLVAYGDIPSFIVSLGGLIAYGGAAFLVARGETVGLVDANFKLIGGNPPSSWIGGPASWALGGLICLFFMVNIISNRSARSRFKFPQRPMWAELFLVLCGCAVVVGVVSTVNAFPWPLKLAEKYAKEHELPVPPEGLFYPHGFAIPVLIALAVGVAMNFIARRTRFGRYVYAIGGNPEAAELAGINTRRITVMLFSLMGLLSGIGACIATARLESATNSLGKSDELYAIAVAVIGGTTLAGGAGTIYGAMLGALVMQSLQSGMELTNAPSAAKDIVVGCVLVFAVWVDQLYRRRQS